jgi:hypothetical protein
MRTDIDAQTDPSEPSGGAHRRSRARPLPRAVRQENREQCGEPLEERVHRVQFVRDAVKMEATVGQDAHST